MSSIDWQVISQSALRDKQVRSRGFIRAYCHIHDSDKQRSLSINVKTGFGQCHKCGAQVLVRELNEQAAANIERSQGRIDAGEIKVRDPKYIARAARQPKQPAPRSIKRWQQEEIDLLRSLHKRAVKRLADERARAYIEGRGLSLETAQRLGLGYVPAGQYDFPLSRWSDHIIIPVHHPEEGLQFAGRCLKLWEPGMDENKHKEILDEQDIDRWLKTHAGGWFNLSALETALRVTFVEGAFDCLSLIESGMPDTIAIIGTALDVGWLPGRLEHITLAFDGDESGIEKSGAARDALYLKGYEVTVCRAPQDDMGKDWSERYRLHGAQGLAILTDCQEEDDLHCWCGAEVEYYSAEGLPYCAQHLPPEPEPVDTIMNCDETPAPFTSQEQFTQHVRNLFEPIFGPCEMRVFPKGTFTHDMRLVELQEQERVRENAARQRGKVLAG